MNNFRGNGRSAGGMKRRLRLIEGNRMRCPRCKNQHDILEYVPLMQIEEFESQTAPVYKCPSCLWVFALRFPEDVHIREDVGVAR